MTSDQELHLVPFPLTLDVSAIPFDSGEFDADYVVGGIEWLSYASKEYPYQRSLSRVLKEQLDTSQQPGDASLDGWWVRSQTDWSGGAGQEFMEPANDDLVLRSYMDSANVDVFTNPGDVTLLPKQAEIFRAQLTSTKDPVMVKLPGGDFVIAYGNTVHSPGWLADHTLTGLAQSIIVAGDKILVSVDDNTVEVLATNGTKIATIDHTAVPGVPMMRWVKGRVILGVSDRLYELVGLAADITLVDSIPAGSTRDQTMPIVIMRDSTWQFSGACGTPQAILVSGYGASGSTIQALTIDDKGALPDISAPIEVAQLPSNEKVIDLVAYLGTYVGIGTDKGLRVGTVSDGGGLVYGPLIGSPVPAQRVGTFSVFDRFLHYVDQTGAFIKVDLSTADEAGRYAWSRFTQYPGAVGGVVLGSRESMMIATETIGAGDRWVTLLHFTDANGPAASGWLTTSAIRLGTLERKYFDEISVQLKGSSVDGAVNITANGNDLGSATQPKTVLKFGSASAADDMTLRFDFTPGTAAGPTLQAWSLRAMPAIEDRGQQVLLPCLNFDFEKDSLGVSAGWEGRAWERWEAAVRLYTRGSRVSVTETKTVCTYEAVVEDMTFTQVAPPKGASGFGGVVQIVLRTV